MNPKITIILVNWNGLKDTIECLESIQKIDYPNFNVVVVDNGSNDNSCEVIKEKFPDTILIANETNLGFSGAMNLAITRLMETDTEYFFMLNNDTIVDADILKEFIAAAKNSPDAGMFGGKIFYYSEPNKIWFAGGNIFDKKNGVWVNPGNNEIDDGTRNCEVRELDCINGCALFFSRKVVEETGLFDEKFFAYYEETDWCFRARKKGFKALYIPTARLWHKVSASLGGERFLTYYYYMSRNSFLWVKKNFPFPLRIKFYFSHFCLFLFYCSSTRNPEYENHIWLKRLYWDLSDMGKHVGKAKILGFYDFFCGRFGECRRPFYGG